VGDDEGDARVRESVNQRIALTKPGVALAELRARALLALLPLLALVGPVRRRRRRACVCVVDLALARPRADSDVAFDGGRRCG
jgi:hypothetical protein